MYTINRDIDSKVVIGSKQMVSAHKTCDVCIGNGMIKLSDGNMYTCPKCKGRGSSLVQEIQIVEEEVIITAIQISRTGIVYNGISANKSFNNQRRFKEEDIIR